MTYVYILKSIRFSDEYYVGTTDDLRQRLRVYNQKSCSHSAKFAPWKVEMYVAISDEKKARDFEKYLKSGSGTAFRKKRL